MTMFAMKHHNCPTCRCTEQPTTSESVYDAIMPATEQAKLISDQQSQIATLQHELAICMDALRAVVLSAKFSECGCVVPCDCSSGAIFAAGLAAGKALEEVNR